VFNNSTARYIKDCFTINHSDDKMCSFRSGNPKILFSRALFSGKLNLNLRITPGDVKREGRKALLFSVLAFLVMTQIVLGLQQVSVSITSSGTMTSSPSPTPTPTPPPIQGTLLFSSGFEDSRDRGTSGNGDYNLRIYNQVTGTQTHTYTYDGGSSVDRWWINGRESAPSGAPTVTAHSGSYCLGIYRGGNNRAELQFRDWGWASYDEWYFSMWLYFPSNWDTTPASSSGGETIFAFGDSIYHASGGSADGGFPYIDIEFWRASTPTYTLALTGYDYSNHGRQYDTYANFPLPKGQWSHWEIYFDRGDVDAHNGVAWVKVNGIEYVSATGIYAKWSGGYPSDETQKVLEIYPQDLYASGYGTEYRFLDDLEIWSGVPT
jgi:hypothetical protein